MTAGIGTAALGSLLAPEAFAGGLRNPGGAPHFAPKAKRVICMHQGGAPSHIDLYDYKPGLEKHRGIDLPASVRMGQRITQEQYNALHGGYSGYHRFCCG